MKIFCSAQAAKGFCRRGSAVTMGNYDGLHAGHRHILQALRDEAKKRGIPAVVYTFEPHPVKVLAPAVAPPLINTLAQKIELLRGAGIDAVVVEKFDRTFARHSAGDFFKRYLVGRLNAKFITVGYDFTFGAKRQGNIETLEILAFRAGIDVKIIDPFMKGSTLVSSTLIRKYVQSGDVKRATTFLGRPFFVEGKVMRGTGRGKKLGISTANLRSENELMPKTGVYATRVFTGDPSSASGGLRMTRPSVTNIGFNPTFGGKRLSIETHIFGLKKPLYGKTLRVYFVERIRDERKFRNEKELVKQIKKDITQTQRILR